MLLTDHLTLATVNPAGYLSCGSFNPQPAPTDPALQESFAAAQSRWLARIDKDPNSFNGHRAVLTGYRVSGEQLLLETAYRTYADGRALRDALQAARAAGRVLPPRWLRLPNPAWPWGLTQPNPIWSWGLSLLTAVLLPGNLLLCGKRSDAVLHAPGEWHAFFTEIVEPKDMAHLSMQPLLDRLVAEELPSLVGKGVHRLVGLGVREVSYTWQLFSVLDLRNEPQAQALELVGALAPDHETAAWATIALNAAQPESADSSRPHGAGVSRAELTPLFQFLAKEAAYSSCAG